jgi:hypothetical protein|nr:MAG TPA: hypothetical protein [Caudoviricetes sp.]
MLAPRPALLQNALLEAYEVGSFSVAVDAVDEVDNVDQESKRRRNQEEVNKNKIWF